MNARFWMHIYTSFVCKVLFFHVYKWDSLFREKDDLNCTDINSPVQAISLNFARVYFSIYVE